MTRLTPLLLMMVVSACRGGEADKDTAVFDPRDAPASDTEIDETDTDADTEAPTDADTELPEDADGDGIPAEEDCDDNDPTVGQASTWYVDGDGDGYGDERYTTEACEQPSGYAARTGDCDDADPAYNPGAAEEDCTDPEDYNCDGSVGWADDDGDGWAACEECDDGDASVNPDATESCDETDEDCDGSTDEEADDAATWYADADGDGYGDAETQQTTCVQPSGYVEDDSDCDDGLPATYPGADETCDETDEDCDGDVDEEPTDASTWYADDDEDGYGDADDTTESCTQPTGTVDNADDCNDATAQASPDGTEVCDTLDNDCDGDADEDGASDANTWYADSDGDGFGDADVDTVSCEAPTGYVDDDADCDDDDADVNPDGSETCDEVDEDCDGDVDEDASDASTWWLDYDGDGYGGDRYSTESCEAPSGYAETDDDCDDVDSEVNPGASEACNDVDDDCDGDADEDYSTDVETWYADADEDGYGDPDVTTEACEEPSGYTDDDSDCDDGDADTNPDASETCDGEDDDCDESVDEDFDDADGDGDANCVDASIWEDDFDDSDWGEWSSADLGGSNSGTWTMSGSTLYEVSNAANSAALGPDLGELENYTVTVDVAWGGRLNNGGGIVFAYQDTSNFLMVRWLDPQDDYGYYSNQGRVDLYACVAGSCSVLETDDGTQDLSVSTGTWVEMSVRVDGEDITATLDGTDLFTYAYGASPVGADTIGVWTYDNDGGVYYDNFAVTNP